MHTSNLPYSQDVWLSYASVKHCALGFGWTVICATTSSCIVLMPPCLRRYPYHSPQPHPSHDSSHLTSQPIGASRGAHYALGNHDNELPESPWLQPRGAQYAWLRDSGLGGALQPLSLRVVRLRANRLNGMATKHQRGTCRSPAPARGGFTRPEPSSVACGVVGPGRRTELSCAPQSRHYFLSFPRKTKNIQNVQKPSQLAAQLA